VRRAGGLWSRITDFGTLLAAARRAARGKSSARSAARFLERVEALALQRELETGAWRPGRPQTFVVEDPKRRVVSAIPFRDQVVHHALISILQPVFERRMVFDSYACRVGKGQHGALGRARRLVRRFGFFLKMDIRSFFPSVRHSAVLETLSRVVKDRETLDLCATILRGPPGACPTDRGLPIGALTSQWFANLLLDRLDHHAKEVLRAPGYLRYMDDFVLFADSRDRLQEAHASVAAFLRERLHLEEKSAATILAPCTEGLPFLGWLIFPGTMRLRPENTRRFRRRLRLRRREMESGRRTSPSFRAAVASMFELLRQGATTGLRRRLREEVSMEM
jgi:hypothetical protein